MEPADIYALRGAITRTFFITLALDGNAHGVWFTRPETTTSTTFPLRVTVPVTTGAWEHDTRLHLPLGGVHALVPLPRIHEPVFELAARLAVPVSSGSTTEQLILARPAMRQVPLPARISIPPRSETSLQSVLRIAPSPGTLVTAALHLPSPRSVATGQRVKLPHAAIEAGTVPQLHDLAAVQTVDATLAFPRPAAVKVRAELRLAPAARHTGEPLRLSPQTPAAVGVQIPESVSCPRGAQALKETVSFPPLTTCAAARFELGVHAVPRAGLRMPELVKLPTARERGALKIAPVAEPHSDPDAMRDVFARDMFDIDEPLSLAALGIRPKFIRGEDSVYVPVIKPRESSETRFFVEDLIPSH